MEEVHQTPGLTSRFALLLKSRRTLTPLVGFSMLCIVGQMLTFGMGYLWPVVLRTSGLIGGSVLGPAAKLMVIRCWGIPGAVVVGIVLLSPLGHRWSGFFAGLAFSIALSVCAVTMMYGWSGPVVVIPARLSLIAGQTFSMNVNVFTSESFPTEVR